MNTWFQGNIEGAFRNQTLICISNAVYAIGFSMCFAEPLMIALPDYPFLTHQNGSYHWVGCYPSRADGSQLKAALHILIMI
jgi:hypothetical protein